MSCISLLRCFNGMSGIGEMKVDSRSLVNGEHNARPLECSRNDVLVFDVPKKLLSNMLGVIRGVLSLVRGDRNPLIRLEENMCMNSHARPKKKYWGATYPQWCPENHPEEYCQFCILGQGVRSC